ncbi:MAG: hypothetical protein MAGBODY4_00382 [Candidatus Marinimicrobia bacterium]|nr:hypothetical protein [Candidatus Neomarinimicrobiota bacterium]
MTGITILGNLVTLLTMPAIIVSLMTLITILLYKFISQMAINARHSCMYALKQQTKLHVIRIRRPPSRRKVAILAGHDKIKFLLMPRLGEGVVILYMTIFALNRSAGIGLSFNRAVALFTIDRQMNTGERKECSIVELPGIQIRPVSRNMAPTALFA